MTKAEKRRFIRELVRNVKNDVLAKVPKMPDNWDGHELRRYLADQFEGASITLGDGPYRRDNRARYRAYKNTCIVTGL